ncbi:alpha-amylase family glycosyl hydrolase [Belliella kenyensis]|uniref:Alpha-amylase family glycosyl hydrolase n=1 Tax=Belliella kenyensis TaxID=1472724 RepID=A0ABV8EFI4_9BACT|nr:alpha-amylase family glycosyl hydrolase [Belliella kenyensis]MCH7401891.1 alpha-amylase family glycosyl hydrolase [Belliella kenyensis]MDN3604391.1 alpha-amylase family glycosyl hydrolase [Belliella kenyensis]
MILRFTNTLVFLALFAFQSQIMAQITTQPNFPKADQNIKIIYDASKGTTGLIGAEAVYVHIGAVIESQNSTTWAIVPFQWGTSNPQARMTRVEGEQNIWEWEVNPSTLFETSPNQTIYRLGMVFRNANGSREGKSETNGDFFIDLSQGFDVFITKPNVSSLLLELGENQEISIGSSEIADLSILIDGQIVLSELQTDQLTYTFNANNIGSFVITAKAELENQEVSKELLINVVDQSPQAQLPSGVLKGINYISESEVVLVLEAPLKKNAFVIGDFNDWQIHPDYQMFQTPDKEKFWLRISGLESKKEYIFQYLVDGNLRIGDPYADKVSDPFHDQEIIDQNRYPDLRPFPNGKTNFQASYLQTNQDPYLWKYTEYKKPKPEELVVYELLVRDFDDRRTYQAVIDRLDYLKDLGINALELMPVKEFEGNLSWGYNPTFFFAPDKYYGTKNDLKQLIDEAHKRDIVVILDMVLNHAFGQNPMVRLYNDGDYGAPTLDNPWFNREAKHPFNVGYDFNHESSYTKAFVDSVNHYWLSEYKFDGYRFDLSKGFTQVNSGNDVGFWSQRDESRIAIWKHIYDQIKADFPDAYVILEHFADNSEEQELANYGLMFWGNLNHDFREMAKGNSRNFDWGYFQTRGWNQNNLVSYMESHDEERTMWESLTHGRRSPIDFRQLNHAVNRNQLMATFFFAIPGPKMIWQFEEFGYDLELNNDRLGIKPTRWEYLNNSHRARLYNLYRAMIELKQSHDLFNEPIEVNLSLNESVKSITSIGSEMQLVLYGNFGTNAANNMTMNFPSNGTWYNYFTGEEISVNSGVFNTSLRPNQFQLYTNKKLEMPEGEILEDIITSINPEELQNTKFNLYPNPSNDRLFIQTGTEGGDFNYRVVDMTGRELVSGTNDSLSNILELEIRDFKAGIYIFELYNGRQVSRRRFIKN